MGVVELLEIAEEEVVSRAAPAVDTAPAPNAVNSVVAMGIAGVGAVGGADRPTTAPG